MQNFVFNDLCRSLIYKINSWSLVSVASIEFCLMCADVTCLCVLMCVVYLLLLNVVCFLSLGVVCFVSGYSVCVGCCIFV